jgi:ribosomal-protein-alanine N-acetyltransferase
MLSTTKCIFRVKQNQHRCPKFCMEDFNIFTDRLILKGITPSVIHDLFTTKTKDEIIKFFGTDEKGYEHYKEMHKKGMETHRITFYFFLLVNKNTHLPIGECGFHTLNKTHRRAELFYLLRNDADKQKGFMIEALSLILNFSFTELNLHRIEVLVPNWNIPSIKLLEKYGFVKEGTIREDYIVDDKIEDSNCYSLLSWEWEITEWENKIQPKV